MTTSHVNQKGSAYSSPDYAKSFDKHGDILILQETKIPLIDRLIDPSDRDLTGVYPFTLCNQWDAINSDIKLLKNSHFASLVLVTDPFLDDKLLSNFNGWAVRKAYKKHYSVDLTCDWEKSLSKGTRYLTRKVRETHALSFRPANSADAKNFWKNHQYLIQRHKISGLGLMTQDMLAQQMSIPGAFLGVASKNGKELSSILIFLAGDKAYWYLLGSAPEAYPENTSYGLFYFLLTELQKLGIRWVNLGGNAGMADSATDGLARFKEKWSNYTSYSYLCGEILNAERYHELCVTKQACKNSYFPAYRHNM